MWVVADLKDREFSETHLAGVQAWLVVLSAGILLASLLASATITHWALRPMLALAERVRARVLDAHHERLHKALEREWRFIADCSHELRTPVTTLKGRRRPAHRARSGFAGGWAWDDSIQRHAGRFRPTGSKTLENWTNQQIQGRRQ